MYQLFYLREAENLKNVPPEVVTFAKNALHILDCHYGENRQQDDDGGEVIILTPHDDLCVLDALGIDVEQITPEYSNIIPTSSIEYLHVFTLANNEYSKQYLLPRDKATPNLLDC